jgi:hypothetical protein
MEIFRRCLEEIAQAGGAVLRLLITLYSTYPSSARALYQGVRGQVLLDRFCCVTVI